METTNKIKLLLDTDIGSEMTDAAALTLAAKSGEIDLLGVTTVTGDSVFRASVAKKILTILDRPEVPVSPGYGDGSDTEHAWEKSVIFQDAYIPDNRLDTRPAWQLILDHVNSNTGSITLACIGTLTNLARALYKDPDIPRKVSRLILMGGMIDQPTAFGNKIPRGFEYNFCNDSDSLQSVFRAGFDITILPGDLTFREDSRWSNKDLEVLSSSKSRIANLLRKINDRSVSEAVRNMKANNLPVEFAGPWINDELLITYIIRPELFELKEMEFDLELPDKYPRFINSSSGRRVKIITSVEFPEARKFILERISG